MLEINMQIIKYVFQQHGDNRGQLVALEENKDIIIQLYWDMKFLVK